MPVTKITTRLLFISVITNALFVFVLLIKFNTSPADVYRRLQQAELTISMQLADNKATETQILKVLEERKKWMLELTKALEKGFSGEKFLPPALPP